MNKKYLLLIGVIILTVFLGSFFAGAGSQSEFNPVYRCYNEDTGDHMASVFEDCESDDYVYSDYFLGYVYNYQKEGTHALYRCWNGKVGSQIDHMISTDENCGTWNRPADYILGYAYDEEKENTQLITSCFRSEMSPETETDYTDSDYLSGYHLTSYQSKTANAECYEDDTLVDCECESNYYPLFGWLYTEPDFENNECSCRYKVGVTGCGGEVISDFLVGVICTSLYAGNADAWWTCYFAGQALSECPNLEAEAQCSKITPEWYWMDHYPSADENCEGAGENYGPHGYFLLEPRNPIVPECYQDLDCDDSDEYTIDTCVNPGQLNSDCVYETLECLTDNDCSEGYVCEENECVEEPEIICESDSDCGTDGLIGDLFCNGNDNVHQYYKEFTCNNAGTNQSSCSSITSSILIDGCGYGCENGECINEEPECITNDDCSEGYVCEENECVEEPEIICESDSECGTDSYIGDLFCNGNDNVHQYYKEFTCNNPDTEESYCESRTRSVLSEECEYGCSEGICSIEPIVPECYQDLDCDDSDEYTIDTCVNPGQLNSDCFYETLECLADNDCENGYTCEENECEKEDNEKDGKKGSFWSILGFDNSCISEWECSGWSECSNNGQTRQCEDANSCDIESNKPAETRGCEEGVISLSKEKAEANPNYGLWILIIGSILLIILIILIGLAKRR
ncbi:MAG: hypothetical protein KKA64_00700 [Nanoarchaeota archaeon]|nr:hypothetical protein [Nanoarchaeota archaeon]